LVFLSIVPRVPGFLFREVAMSSIDLEGVQHESLEVGAAPLVRHFLNRLNLPALFEEHLPRLPGRAPALSSSVVLCVLITNLLLGRKPLYALPAWAARRVPEHLGLLPEQLALLNDDCLGRALDHLRRADRASLLVALVKGAVTGFAIDLSEHHQDTTTVTFHGNYAEQPPVDSPGRPPRITFGYNKDHRPDLKQLLYSITISADGAVPVHCKIYDGNTADDQVHQDTWSFLCSLAGHSNFLYVADCKLCSRENMGFIASRNGWFLTVMPRTRAEDQWFREHLQDHVLDWKEVHREKNPRGKNLPDVVYHAVESPQQSTEGYRVLWYRSSQKEKNDREDREKRLKRARARLKEIQGRKGQGHQTADGAKIAGQEVLQEEKVTQWLRVRIEETVEEKKKQAEPGRPGPYTVYYTVTIRRYFVHFDEDAEAVARAAKCDGLFPLMTNDEKLTTQEALEKYKYQPFVEKRHEQLKSVFDVAPMWLKNPGRVESLLWLYYVVELVGALVEREVRKQMAERQWESLPLYPERRDSTAPTAELVFDLLEGHRRHRLLNAEGVELHRFYDPVPDVAHTVLALLDVNTTAYGLE
jgi:transposase